MKKDYTCDAERGTRCRAGRDEEVRDGGWRGYVRLTPENWPQAKSLSELRKKR